jgi:fumarate reductase flavoprotein subunit
MKRVLSMLLCILLAFGLAGCTQEVPAINPTPAPTPEPAAQGKYTPGTYTAQAKGFGGSVTVTIEFDSNAITNVVIDGPNETVGIGMMAVEKMPEMIKEAHGADIDAVSGATITSTAVLQAVDTVLNAAMGVSAMKAKMAAGTYSAEAYGFMQIAPLSVKLTVDETSIKDIEINGNLESKPMVNAINALMVPRILENQSIGVDAITGATVSSNAVLFAARDALIQALIAGGSDASAVSEFLKPEEKVTKSETIDVEVLIVGMGGSGCASAMSAAERMHAESPANVSVLAIDKAGKFGGTSAFCGEPMAVNAPKYKAEFNSGKDYMDGNALYDAWLEYTEGDAKAEIVKKFLDNSGDTIDWLYYNHGFKFNNPLTGFGPNDVYRCKYQYVNISNKEEGRDYGIDVDKSMNEMVDEYFHNLIADYETLGGKYMLETEA